MSCGCNSSPCNCQPRPSVCCTPTVESVEYTFENGNLVGIGVFDNDTDNLVQFRGIVSNSAALTVTLNATDNTIVFDFDQAALVADIPDADTTTRGILETATNAEALAKAATNKILTPSNLAALGSTDTFAGLVELATNAETITGTSTTLAVTPAGLAAAASLYSTVTWADSVARLGATPSFSGQYGVQLDTGIPYISLGTSAGDFSGPMLRLGAVQEINNLGTLINLTNTSSLIFSSTDTTGSVTFSLLDVTFTGEVLLQGQITVPGSASWDIGGAPAPVNSIFVTSPGGPSLETKLISSFLSTNNPQTGYTAFANPATLRTCDTSTVTLPQLAQIVGTLIEDLKAVLLPAT